MKRIHLLVYLFFFFLHTTANGVSGSYVNEPVKPSSGKQLLTSGKNAAFFPPVKSANDGESSAIAITVAGGNGIGSAANQLNAPGGIFVDATGNIYVADLTNNRIQKWAPGASAGITVAGGNGEGSAANQFRIPKSVYVDLAGNIYVADIDNHRIQKWAPGALAGITVAGGNGPGFAANQLAYPNSVYVDATGNIYIADLINHRIQKWAPGALAGITIAGGNGQGSAANQLAFPNGVFVDANGSIYVADLNNQRIQKWVAGATTGITVAGSKDRGSGDKELNNPSSVVVDATGNIYVADSWNHRIQKWASGASSGITVAGGNKQGSAVNQLNYPGSLFVDAAGNIYVSDAANNRIQKFGTRSGELNSCPDNLTIFVKSCIDRAPITWVGPRDTFPDSIQAPIELDPSRGIFVFMGAYGGHGYYKSTISYLWPVAKDIAKYIGGRDVDGNLAVITSAEENNFIFNKIKGTGYSPWIGLANTRTVGEFRWVGGEDPVYSNWAPGEPNNQGGNATNVLEPYVRMHDDFGTWNDQRNDNLPFITEFEKPLIRYKQISGPKNGSENKVGVYQVCYERSDLITDKKDTCCFNITVTCTPPVLNQAVTSPVLENTTSETFLTQSLRIATTPNPSRNTFRLNILSGNNEKITLQVSDMSGKVVETRKGLTPNQALEIGMNYKPGIYFARILQGSKNVAFKLVKQAK